MNLLLAIVVRARSASSAIAPVCVIWQDRTHGPSPPSRAMGSHRPRRKDAPARNGWPRPPWGGHDVEMADEAAITSTDLAELVDRMDEAARAYIRGDLRHYLSLFDHPEDYTLMPPYGGDTQRGYAPTDEQIEATTRFFGPGEARLDVAESYVSGNLAVLVAVERQHGVVGGSEDQDWSLRVTLVFRRNGARWELVHRHADPLVREIPWPLFSRIARGDVES